MAGRTVPSWRQRSSQELEIKHEAVVMRRHAVHAAAHVGVAGCEPDMNALEFVNWLRCPTYLGQVRCCVKVGRNIQAPVQLVGDSAVPAGPRAFSLSKDKIRVLLLEGISERAAALFADAGY